jgi:hypothetical protein
MSKSLDLYKNKMYLMDLLNHIVVVRHPIVIIRLNDI